MQSQLYSTFQHPSKLHPLILMKLFRLWVSKTFKKWRRERATRHTISLMAELPDEILRDIGWPDAVRNETHSFEKEYEPSPIRLPWPLRR
ncbi:hypothetical protein QBD00_004849 [Ochrobactrum sp. AN78]|nr:hypothetical protein [Ochrobactrum sp. AN78]